MMPVIGPRPPRALASARSCSLGGGSGSRGRNCMERSSCSFSSVRVTATGAGVLDGGPSDAGQAPARARISETADTDDGLGLIGQSPGNGDVLNSDGEHAKTVGYA